MEDWWNWFDGNYEEEQRYQAFKSRLEAEQEAGEDLYPEEFAQRERDYNEAMEEEEQQIKQERKLYFLNQNRKKRGKPPLKELPDRYK